MPTIKEIFFFKIVNSLAYGCCICVFQSNATGGATVKVEQVTRRGSGPHLAASGKRSHHRKPGGPSIITIIPPGKQTPVKTGVVKKRGHSGTAASSAPKQRKVAAANPVANGNAEDGEFACNNLSEFNTKTFSVIISGKRKGKKFTDWWNEGMFV